MRVRNTRLGRIAAVVILMTLVPVSASADDRGFNSLVGYIKSNYHAKRQGSLGMITFARLLVKMIKPAGVKDFKVSMMKELDYASRPVGETGLFHPFPQGLLSKEWQPLVQYHSRRNNQSTYVYAQELKSDMKLLVLTMQRREAYVVQVKFSPEKLIAFMNDPRVMGISLSDKLEREEPQRLGGTKKNPEGENN